MSYPFYKGEQVKANFDNLVYSQDDVIHFDDGIPGFEKNRDFVIVKDENYAPFEWLVCVDGTRLRFAMLNPMIVDPEYNPCITKSQIEGLGLETPEDILMYCFVTIAPNPSDSTINFMGPVIINTTMKKGRQLILENSAYGTKEPILRNG